MDTQEFDGVFKFTNASTEDFTVMWNSKEYLFPATSTCPLIMPEHTLEEVQAIRKKFAYKYAQREFAKSKIGVGIEKEASKHLNPATYDEKLLQPYIDQCLSPLPIASAKVTVIPKKKPKFIDGGTAVMDEQKSVQALSSATGEFADYVPPVLGQMQG